MEDRGSPGRREAEKMPTTCEKTKLKKKILFIVMIKFIGKINLYYWFFRSG